ncbi:MAG: hypothetical protein KAW12_04670 [Candidatus Aminicenantes bacterium]|nr:hypothetical protein [Candidatus Aminicenantes bacterium]
MNIKGEIQKKIEIPYFIETDYVVKKDVICFVSKDRKIHWYNWKKKVEKKLPEGPFIYSEKCNGPEIYNNIDFSVKDRILTFDVRPEYVIDMPGDINAKKYNYQELIELSEIFLININDQKLVRITNNGSSIRPSLYKDKILFHEGVSVILLDIKNKDRLNLLELYLEYEKKDKFKKYTGLGLIKIINDDLILFEYNYSDGKLEKIVEFNLTKNQFKILSKLRDNKKEKNIYLQHLSDISMDRKKLLLIEDNSKIYCLNLEDMKLKVIKETKVKFLKAKFY